MTGELEVGTVLAGYRIEGMAGRGGMGVVYVAEHVHLGRRVALKVLAPELAADQSFRERFIRESRLAATIEHPNAIPVYDAGEADGVLYIAMRLVQGTDLRAVLDRDGRIEPERALAILAAVAGALDTAHADGLVHRDVKPANILLEPNRHSGEDVFLTDFGLTKRMGPGSRYTQTGAVVGTLDYMAPEQIQGGELSGRVDQYALGCVLFECLTGQPPYPRETEVSAMYAHLEEPPPAVTALRPGLPAAIDGVVARSMAKSPDDRFATCGEMVGAARTALEPGAGGTSGAAPPPTAAIPTAIRSAVHRAGAPPAPAVPEVPAAPPKPQRRSALPVAAVVVALALIGTTIAIVAGGTGPTHSGGSPSTRPSNPVSAAGSNGAPTPSTNPVPGVTNGRIAFVENEDVVSVLPDGAGRTLLTSSATRHAEIDSAPAWSPDGTKIAVIREDVSGVAAVPVSTIVVVPVGGDGAPGTEFEPADISGVRSLAWSPDSGSIAADQASPQGPDQVIVVSAVPHSRASPVGLAVPESTVAFSGDGRVVFFVDAPDRDVFGVSIDQGLRGYVAKGSGTECCPQPAPTGHQVAFVGGSRDLMVGTFGRRSGTVLANGPVSTTSLPRWSPDGGRLLFVSNRTGDDDVYVVNADGTGLRDLTPSPQADTDPVWSPDGTKIAFVSRRGGHAQIYVMNADGSDPVNVSNTSFDDSAPSWQAVPAAPPTTPSG